MILISIGKWIINVDQDLQRSFFSHAVLFFSNSSRELYGIEQSEKAFFWYTIPFPNDFETWDSIYHLSDSSISSQVYKHRDGSLMIRFFEISSLMHCFVFSPDFRQMKLLCDKKPDVHLSDLIFRNLGLMFSYSVITNSGLVLHAVVMEWRGKAILVSATSGTGKSTHAHLWQESEHVEIINGDRALCGVEDCVWTAYGQPWCGSSGECLNTSAPIGAVVLLERGEENSVMRLEPFDAVLGLLPRTFAPPWDAALMDAALSHLDSLVASVPVFRLHCRPDVEAVETLKAALEPLFPQGGGQG